MKGFLVKNFLSSNNTNNKNGSDDNEKNQNNEQDEIDKNENEENTGEEKKNDVQASQSNNENNKSNEINDEEKKLTYEKHSNDNYDPPMNEQNYITTNASDGKFENDNINSGNNELGNNEYKKKDNAFSSIDKMTFYECVLKQLADDSLFDSYNTLKREINLEENVNSENNFLFNLYQKRLYNYPSNVVDSEETKINKLAEYNSLNKKKSHIYNNNNLILNYENNSNKIRQIYSYEINNRIELIHKSKCICCANNSSRNILCSASSDSTIKMIKINDLKKKKYFL